MGHQKTKTMSRIIIGVLILILFKFNTFSVWYVNGSEGGFVGSGDENDTGTTIGDYVVDGAGYFLESYTNILDFMKKVEWSQKQVVSNDELVKLLDTALDNMKQANQTYIGLKQLADTTPYNYAVIDALKSFDYDGFQVEKNLNDGIFTGVRNYLAKGDIRGIYGKIIADTEQIVVLLNRVKENVNAGVFPPLKETWKLNQSYSQSLLFGQYIAQIFDCI